MQYGERKMIDDDDDDFLSIDVEPDLTLEGELIPADDMLALEAEPEDETIEPKFSTQRDARVYQFCLLGASNNDLCKMLNIAQSTFHRWRKEKPGFERAIRLGKEQADARVAKSLFQRAVGYTHKETKIATHLGTITDREDFDKHYPPDVKAIEMWLTNRDPERWKNIQRTELTGKNGQPLATMNANVDVTKMSNIEKASRLVSVLNKAVKTKEDDNHEQ